MMLSPEKYNQLYLKGKSKEEIFEIIENLKKKIRNLKMILDGRYSIKADSYPSGTSILMHDWEYLELAIEAYKDAGGEYFPDEDECRDAEFNASLDHVSRIEFRLNNSFRENDERTLIIENDRVLVNAGHAQMEFLIRNRNCYEFSVRDELITGLKKLHMYDWKKIYHEDAMDGTNWELKIHFDGDRQPLEYYGRNLFPYNFEALRDLLTFEDEIDDDIDEKIKKMTEDEEEQYHWKRHCKYSHKRNM
ncbi:MAG: hypothetical protein ACI32N_10060 [Bulleidia sp.]